MSFLPENYTPPKTGGNYMKLEQGDNRFRVLCEHPIIGYEYWTPDKKPIRTKEMPRTKPEDMEIRDEKKHWTDNIKHFWAMIVWDYAEEKLKILQITQPSIQNPLLGYFNDPDWGHPSSYDIVINRTGEGMETRYQVMPKPHKPLTDEQKEAQKQPVNLNALYDSEDPFAALTPAEQRVQDFKQDVEFDNLEDLPSF